MNRTYISGAVEYDDRAENPVCDRLVESVATWRVVLARTIAQAKEKGHLCAEADPQLVLFEVYSLELGLHHDARFLRLLNGVELAMVALSKLIQLYRTWHGRRTPSGSHDNNQGVQDGSVRRAATQHAVCPP